MYQDSPYFYTDTIYDFNHLLVDDNLKMIIVQSLSYLVKKWVYFIEWICNYAKSYSFNMENTKTKW